MASNILDLPPDLLASIAKRITDVTDIFRAQAVCHYWKSIFKLRNFSATRQVPWLMLAEREDSDFRSFFNPSTSEIYEIPLPELWQKRIAGSAHGWLVTIGDDWEIHLFNPLTRVQIKLPPHRDFFAYDYDLTDVPRSDILTDFLRKVVLLSDPSEGDFLVVALYSTMHMVAILRPGDKVWTVVGGEDDWKRFGDLIYYKGNIYTIDEFGWFGMFDFSSEPKAIQLGRLPPAPGHNLWNLEWYRYTKYLVELSGDLLVIARRIYDCVQDNEEIIIDDDLILPEVVLPYKTMFFKVYKLDQIEPNLKWVEVKDLGNYSVFVGQNTSFTVRASEAGAWCRRNCIYFTDDPYFCLESLQKEAGRDQGVSSLDDGSFQDHYQGLSCSYHSPPIWFRPSLL